jgi:hypothetical protein
MTKERRIRDLLKNKPVVTYFGTAITGRLVHDKGQQCIFNKEKPCSPSAK